MWNSFSGIYFHFTRTESFFLLLIFVDLLAEKRRRHFWEKEKSPASLMFALEQEVWLEISRISSRRKVTLKAPFRVKNLSLLLLSIFFRFSHTKPSDDCENVQKGKILIFRSCFCSSFGENCSAKWKFSFSAVQSHANMCDQGQPSSSSRRKWAEELCSVS